LVIDMMRKIESFCSGRRDSRSSSPWVSKWAMRPRRATSVTAPANVRASMCRCIRSVTRTSRSDDRPTSSGFAVGAAAASGHPSTAANKTTSIENLMTERVCMLRLLTRGIAWPARAGSG
jgi:hypothetical protein